MDIFVGRQPIFDIQKRTRGYELLYRSCSHKNFCELLSGTEATASLLDHVFCTVGINKICGGKRAFINFTEDMLLYGIPAINPNKIVVEVLETVIPTPEIVEACKRLKEKKYLIALDDFIFDGKADALLPLADIVKVDWKAIDPSDTEKKLDTLKKNNLKLLAEKIETYEEFEKAASMGFQLFQGYFFAKPKIIAHQAVPASATTLVKLMAEVQRPDLDLNTLTHIIEWDASICYKLLRIVNSASYYQANPIKSVKHALQLLGETEIKKWFAMILIPRLNQSGIEELVVATHLRSCFAEQVAIATHHEDIAPTVFLTVLFSRLDCMIGRPLEELIGDLPIDEEIHEALLEKKGRLRPFVDIVNYYEIYDDEHLEAILAQFDISHDQLATCYLKAIDTASIF